MTKQEYRKCLEKTVEVIKKKITNLTVNEAVTLAADIIDEIEKIVQPWDEGK